MKRKTKRGLSRRKFIKMASTGAAAIALGPIAAAASAGKSFSIVPNFTVSGLGHVAPSDKLYIAAIGCGGEGGNEIEHYATAPQKNGGMSFLWSGVDRK